MHRLSLTPAVKNERNSRKVEQDTYGYDAEKDCGAEVVLNVRLCQL